MQRRRSTIKGAGAPANEVETIVWLAHTLWRTFDPAIARDLEAKLEVAPIRRIAAVEHAFRDPRTHRRLGLDFLEVAPERLPWADDLGSGRMIAFGVLTLVRSGYHRQYGLQRIASLEGRLPTAFVLARTNDYVTVVRDIAISSLTLACTPARAADLVACLPLVRRFSEWTRASRTSLEERITAMLTSGDPACDVALEEATLARDPDVRFEALRLRAARHARTPAIAPVLERALGDRVSLTRLWAARFVVGDDVPDSQRGPLLDRMELDRAPSVRMVALPTIERFLSDPRPSVAREARRTIAYLSER